jgi:hypothetical protein
MPPGNEVCDLSFELFAARFLGGVIGCGPVTAFIHDFQIDQFDVHCWFLLGSKNNKSHCKYYSRFLICKDNEIGKIDNLSVSPEQLFLYFIFIEFMRIVVGTIFTTTTFRDRLRSQITSRRHSKFPRPPLAIRLTSLITLRPTKTITSNACCLLPER